MPICQKCGGYYVRSPCPYCNPPQEIATSPSADATIASADELLETLQNVEAEMNTLIEESNERRIALEIKLKNQKAELTPKKAELQEVGIHLSQIQQSFDQMSSQIENLGLNKLEEEKNSLLSNIDVKEKKIKELQNSKPHEKLSIENVESNINQLNEKIDKKDQENKSSIDKTQKEISDLELKLKSLKEQISAKDKEFAELKAQK